MSDRDRRRIQLVVASEPTQREALLTGIGLLAGLFLGRSSLMGAVTGAERIEAALAHFVLVVLVCVGGLLTVGRLVDQATDRAAATERKAEGDTEATGANGGDTTLVPSDEVG